MMMFSRLLATSCAALMLSILAPVPAQAIPTVTLSGPASVTAGSRFTVDVRAADVADLYAYQFDLGFDSAMFRLDGAEEGAFLASAGPTLFDPGTVAGDPGTLSFLFATLLGPTAGVEGDGILATLHFTSLAVGSSVFELGNLVLLDAGLNDIPAAIGQLDVTAVPEPASWALMLAGGALLVLRRRRWPGGRRVHA